MTNAVKRRRRGDAAFWRTMVKGQGESGLCIRSYCRKHGLAESAFYYWRRRLNGEGAGSGKRIPIVSSHRRETPARFAAVTMVSPNSAELGREEMEAVLAGGVRLRIGGGVPVERAVSFLRAFAC